MANVLGISFSSDKIRFTELSGNYTEPRLENLETVAVDFNFEDSLADYKSNQKILTNISNEISNYFSKRKQAISKTSLAISSSQAFIITLPINFSEGKESINTKIYWELSNYFPENYNEFVINTYRLNRFLPASMTDEFLIIAVLKNTIEFVKRVFKICNIGLTVIDIDHFAAENTVRKNYPLNTDTSGAMLIGLKPQRIDYGYINDNKYSHFAYSKYTSEVELNLSLVKKLNSLFDSELINNRVSEIFLYGEDIRPDTTEVLKNMSDITVTSIDPFANINAQTELLKNEELRKEAYRYSSSCGAALRCLSGK